MNREEFVQQIKDCGQSIIDDAEQIFNHFQFSTNGLEIVIEINSKACPTITVVKKFIPEQFIKRLEKS